MAPELRTPFTPYVVTYGNSYMPLVLTCLPLYKINPVYLFTGEGPMFMKEEGHITEEVYDRLGFNPDTNYA